MSTIEVWRPIVGYEGMYSVSNLGRIQSHERMVPLRGSLMRLQRGRMLMPQIDKATGYPKVMLSNGKSPRPRSVHSIVAEAFLGSRPAGLQVAHKDGDRTNFTASNLRYDSQAGNEADKIAHGTRLRGEAVGNSKLTSESVKAIKESKLPQREIAAAFGISQGHVSEIKSGKKWRHTEAGA